MNACPDFPPEGDSAEWPLIELVTWVATPRELKLWVRIQPFEVVVVYSKQGPGTDEHGTWRHDVYDRETGDDNGTATLNIGDVVDMLEDLVRSDPALRAINDAYYASEETF